MHNIFRLRYVCIYAHIGDYGWLVWASGAPRSTSLSRGRRWWRPTFPWRTYLFIYLVIILYIYIYICIHTVYIYIYIYIQTSSTYIIHIIHYMYSVVCVVYINTCIYIYICTYSFIICLSFLGLLFSSVLIAPPFLELSLSALLLSAFLCFVSRARFVHKVYQAQSVFGKILPQTFTFMIPGYPYMTCFAILAFPFFAFVS